MLYFGGNACFDLLFNGYHILSSLSILTLATHWNKTYTKDEPFLEALWKFDQFVQGRNNGIILIAKQYIFNGILTAL